MTLLISELDRLGGIASRAARVNSRDRPHERQTLTRITRNGNIFLFKYYFETPEFGARSQVAVQKL